MASTPHRDIVRIVTIPTHEREGGADVQDTLLKLWCDAVNRVHEIKTNQRGATAVEYGIMVALIAAVIILVVTSVGQKTSNSFQILDDNMFPAPPVP
ncbi:MAG: Flp family type IVb pilin [Acidimicrobiia bacterium]